MAGMPRVGFQSMARAGKAYKNVNARTATPGQILLKLYDGAIRFTRQAKMEIEAGNPGEKGKHISRTMAIIDEFIAALDHDQAPEFCANLEQIYMFCIDQLATANAKMDAEPLDTVIWHLTQLRDAWEQAVNNTEV